MSKIIHLSSGITAASIPTNMWNNLVKEIVNSDFCFMCRKDLSREAHDKECPLYTEKKK